MVDPGKLRKQRTNGHKAQHLWDDPTIQGFFTAQEEDIRNGWKSSKGGERELREEIYFLMRATEDLKQRFKNYIATGKLAAKQLEELERK